jgi:hypothetical protein
VDLIQANLGNALVTIRTSPDAHGESYVIRRGYRQPAAITSSVGRSLTGVDLERGTFLPLDAYGSAEIESIADESLGEKRRTLLDELVGEELRTIQLALGQFRRELEGNTDDIRAANRLIADLTEQIEEVGDARGRLMALPPPAPGEQPDALVQAAQQQQVNEREAQNLARARAAVAGFREDLQQVVQRRAKELGQSLTVEGSANLPLLQEADQVLAVTVDSLTRSLAALDAGLGRSDEALLQIAQRLEAAQATHKADYDRLQERNVAASQAVRERTAREQEVARLTDL